MGEETAAAREVYERPGAVTRRAAVGEGARRHSQRHGALCSASLGKLTASFCEEDRQSVGAVFFFPCFDNMGVCHAPFMSCSVSGLGRPRCVVLTFLRLSSTSFSSEHFNLTYLTYYSWLYVCSDDVTMCQFLRSESRLSRLSGGGGGGGSGSEVRAFDCSRAAGRSESDSCHASRVQSPPQQMRQYSPFCLSTGRACSVREGAA